MNPARIVVAGGGPVGLALACAACGETVDVIEASASPPALDDAMDVRIFALSAGTRDFLRELGAWQRLDPGRISPVRRMEVFGDEGARLSFDGHAGGAVAWIVEAGRLAAALEAQARAMPSITIHRGVEVTAARADAAGAQLQLAGGRTISGELLVGADGPDSPVRRMLGLGAREYPYGETALVANFACERPHGGVARQWFRADGVLAWLPLPGDAISIVWSAPGEVAESLLGLEPEGLQRRVRDAGGASLGDLQLISRVAGFPLRSIRVDRVVVPGVALAGDAAHAVHPLAGQGVNLGFQDAKCLAAVLASRSPLERPGDLRLLRRYARARSEDVAAMQWVTYRLDRLFSSQAPSAALLRNAGLRLVDSLPWAKRVLTGRAMR